MGSLTRRFATEPGQYVNVRWKEAERIARIHLPCAAPEGRPRTESAPSFRHVPAAITIAFQG